MSEGDELGQAPKGYKYKRTQTSALYQVSTMELCRSLVIRNISAEDLQDVRRIFRIKVYALVSISGDPFIPAGKWNSTTVDYEGGTDPPGKPNSVSPSMTPPSTATSSASTSNSTASDLSGTRSLENSASR